MSGAQKTEKRPLVDDLRDLLTSPRELWIAYVIWYVENIGIFSMIYTLVLWLSVDFGYDDRGAANWATVFSSCATLFLLVTGFVGDALGLRRGMIVGFGLLAVGRFMMGFAPGRGMAITGLMIMCVGYAGCTPVMNTAFRRFSHPRARAFAFSIYYVILNVGGATAGFIVDACRKRFLSSDGKTLEPRVVHLPVLGDHTLTAYRTVFLVGAGCAVVSFLLTLLLRDGVDTEAASEGPSAEPVAKPKLPWQIAGEVMREVTFWRFMLLVGLLVFVKMIFQHGHFTLPKYALRELGESFPIGKFQTINPIAIIFLVPLATALTRHMRAFPVMLVGSVISAGSVFILVLPASYFTIAAFYLLLAVGESLWSPRSYEYIATIAPRGRESSYMGLSGLPFFLAKLGALPMSGWLLSKYCPAEGPRHASTMWLIIGLTTVIAPVFMFALRSVIEGPKLVEGAPR
jgi:MFS family permease